MENKLAPKIRFSGFTDAWEQRKLGEVVQITMGQSPSSKNYTDNLDDHILVQGNADMKNGRVLPRVWTTQVTKQAEKNDLILSVRAPVGDVGKTDFDVVIGRGIAAIKGNEFIFQLLGRMKENGYWSKLSTGSIFESINLNDIKGAHILISSDKEQNKIGTFFQNLDNLIALHQRKLNMLKKTKRGYLQQMFPQNGESAPRLHFANFFGGWEQRKLGELVDTVKSYSLSRDVETSEHTGFRYIHYGDIHKKVADLIEDDNQLPIIKAGGYELLQKGDVIIADASEDYIGIAEPSIILGNPKDKIVAGLHTIAMRPKEIDSLFLYYLLHTDGFKKFGNKVGTGMKVFGITTNNLYKFLVLLPNIEKQIKIGSFFKQLDDAIILNQKKLDKLKSFKKSYLQKMFI